MPDEQIREGLRYVFVLIGLEVIPEDIERDVLIIHIRKYFSEINKTDIVAAFELGIEGRLTIAPEEVIVKSFKKFSPAHFSKVMKAYKVYKAGVKQEAIKQIEPPEEWTEERKKRLSIYFFEKVILPLFWEFKETGIINFGSTKIAAAYNNLIDRGHLKPCEGVRLMYFNYYKVNAGSKERAVELSQAAIIKLLFKKKVNELLQHDKAERERARREKEESSKPGRNSIKNIQESQEAANGFRSLGIVRKPG